MPPAAVEPIVKQSAVDLVRLRSTGLEQGEQEAMDQRQYLCQKAVLSRQWLATHEVIRCLTQAGQGTPEHLAVVYEVLDAIERDLQHLEAKHYRAPTPSRGGRAD